MRPLQTVVSSPYGFHIPTPRKDINLGEMQHNIELEGSWGLPGYNRQGRIGMGEATSAELVYKNLTGDTVYLYGPSDINANDDAFVAAMLDDQDGVLYVVTRDDNTIPRTYRLSTITSTGVVAEVGNFQIDEDFDVAPNWDDLSASAGFCTLHREQFGVGDFHLIVRSNNATHRVQSCVIDSDTGQQVGALRDLGGDKSYVSPFWWSNEGYSVTFEGYVDGRDAEAISLCAMNQGRSQSRTYKGVYARLPLLMMSTGISIPQNWGDGVVIREEADDDQRASLTRFFEKGDFDQFAKELCHSGGIQSYD